MPELPEVESTVRRIKPELTGKILRKITVDWTNMAPGMNIDKVSRACKGACVEDVLRRGKYIIISVVGSDEERHIILHQKMSGRLKVYHKSSSRTVYDHVILEFDDGAELRLTDPRKFGRIYVVPHYEEALNSLGPEPLSKSFTQQQLSRILKKRKGAMKALLLNQSFIAGLGNIYVDEILWRAGIHPLRSAHEVTEQEVTALHRHIKEVLRAAIKAHGTDFGDGVIYGGAYRPAVYGRDGEDCLKCSRKLLKLKVAGRGTHICAFCQS